MGGYLPPLHPPRPSIVGPGALKSTSTLASEVGVGPGGGVGPGADRLPPTHSWRLESQPPFMLPIQHPSLTDHCHMVQLARSAQQASTHECGSVSPAVDLCRPRHCSPLAFNGKLVSSHVESSDAAGSTAAAAAAACSSRIGVIGLVWDWRLGCELDRRWGRVVGPQEGCVLLVVLADGIAVAGAL
jgi:hypothetical protein